MLRFFDIGFPSTNDRGFDSDYMLGEDPLLLRSSISSTYTSLIYPIAYGLSKFVVAWSDESTEEGKVDCSLTDFFIYSKPDMNEFENPISENSLSSESDDCLLD